MDTKKRCKNCFEYVKIYITCFKCDAAYHIHCWKKVPGAYVNETGQLFCCSSLTSNCAATKANFGSQANPPERVIEKGNIDDYFESRPIKQENSEWNGFKCDVCHLEFSNKQYLENHRSECPNIEGDFIQVLKEDKDFENCLHKEEVLEWSEFRCSCLSEFTNQEHLMNHYSECPNKEGEFIQELKEDKDVETHLPEEANSIANEKHLENHCNKSPNKHGESGPGLNKDKDGLCCSVCNEEYFQKESYEEYIKRCHLESSCSQLNKDNSICITNTRSNPAQVNDKKENYKPAVCTFSTPLEDTFGSHQQIDISERLFKCDWCDYTAAQGMNLKIHIKSKHSNAAKKYKCKDCKYSAHTKVNLISHIRTHTNENHLNVICVIMQLLRGCSSSFSTVHSRVEDCH